MNQIEQFELGLHGELRQLLLEQSEIDDHLPECPDVESRWPAICEAYLPDGMREFQQFPTASLGWMMYIGMAVAKFWDEDWEIYGQIANVYHLLRDKRGYDCLDEYVGEDVLLLRDDDAAATASLVQCCATLCDNRLRHEGFEPGTVEALKGYVACLRQMYLMGMAVELHRLGYHMSAM